MKANKKLFIQGSISDLDIESLKADFQQTDFEILKYHSLSSNTDEFLRIIFDDFSLISFARDFILSSLLTSTWESIRKVIKSLIEKNKSVKSITVNLSITTAKGNPLTLKLSADPSKFDILIEQTDKIITVELINTSENITSINVSLDNDNNVQILKL